MIIGQSQMYKYQMQMMNKHPYTKKWYICPSYITTSFSQKLLHQFFEKFVGSLNFFGKLIHLLTDLPIGSHPLVDLFGNTHWETL